MIRKLNPVNLSTNAKSAVQKQLGTQTTTRAVPKSLDPKHFPVFEVPVNQKRLIYVPNHVIMNEDGVEELRMDKPLIHSIIDGNRFLSYRCVNGLEIRDEDGTVLFSGECPLCNATSEPWELAREIINQQCAQQGLDPDDKDNNQVKAIRSAAFSERVLKEANRYYTFPIVVLETVNNDGKTLSKNESGGLDFHIMWYHISETQYQEKWLKILESLEDEPAHPGGHFFILDYTYTPKSGEPNKRDSARNLQVKGKTFKNMDKARAKFDELTKDWTPEKAQETVISNLLYSEADLSDVVDQALENTRNMLLLYRSKGATNEEFQLEKPESTPVASLAASTPAAVTEMDSTDLDDTLSGDDGEIDIG